MKMIGTVRKPHSAVLAICSTLFVDACTPTVFKGDIATSGKGVDQTANAFDGLHERVMAKYKVGLLA
jgi:hypothetical protein